MFANRGITAATASKHISAASKYLSITHNLQYPRSPLLNQVLHRLQSLPTAKQYRLPVTKELVFAVASDTTLDLAIRAAVVLAFTGLLRCSEYCSPVALPSTLASRPLAVQASVFQRQHFSWNTNLTTPGVDGHGFNTHIPHSKSDRYNNGVALPYVPRADDLCPVRWMRLYLASAPSGSPSQPFFTLRNGRFLTRDKISEALQKHAEACGLPPDRISSHSLRIGGIFAMANGGASFETISALARWAPSSAPAMSLLYARMSVGRLAPAQAALAYTPGDPVDFPLHDSMAARRVDAHFTGRFARGEG